MVAMFEAAGVYRGPRARLTADSAQAVAPDECTHTHILRRLCSSSFRHICLTRCATEQNSTTQLWVGVFVCESEARWNEFVLGRGRGSYIR